MESRKRDGDHLGNSSSLLSSKKRVLEFDRRIREKEAEWIRFHHLTLAHNASAMAGKDQQIFTMDAEQISRDIGLTATELEGINLNRQRIIQRGARHGLTCRHWYQGLCSRGDSCEFQHIFDFERPLVCQNYARHNYCNDFLQGYCTLFHPERGDGSTVMSKESDRTEHNVMETVNNGECVHFLMGYCPYGSKCRLTHKARSKLSRPPMLPNWYLEAVTSSREKIPIVSSKEYQHQLDVLTKFLLPLEGIVRNKEINDPLIGNDGSQRMEDITTVKPIINESIYLESLLNIPGTKNTGALKFLCKRIFSSPNPLGYHYTSDPFFKMGQRTPIRFFVIKSLQMRNIYTSVKMGIWATGKNNTKLLHQAFLNSDNVMLFFSANESGGYQGYARMMSLPDPSLYYGIWGPYTPRLGASFRVKWLKQCQVQFEQLLNPVEVPNLQTRQGSGQRSQAIMTNLLNEDKPIKKGRDCTEYGSGLGIILARKLAAAEEVNILHGTDLELN